MTYIIVKDLLPHVANVWRETARELSDQQFHWVPRKSASEPCDAASDKSTFVEDALCVIIVYRSVIIEEDQLFFYSVCCLYRFLTH